ncbi:hypothetical protein ACFY36_51165 [Actinoplanes sp. NPDC000266]
MPADLDLHIRPAGTWDAPVVAGLLAATLLHPALSRWLILPADVRSRQLAAWADALTAERLRARAIRVADDGGTIIGASVWATCPDNAPALPTPLARLQPAPGHEPRWHTSRDQIGQRHPRRAHQHLLALGVQAGRHRQGIGAALLTDWQQHLRPAGLPYHLLAPGPMFTIASRAGYHTLGAPITLGVVSLPVMWLLTPAGTSPDLDDPARAGAGAW